MKGLASTSPAFASVKISERSARRHYGINCGYEYLELVHGNARKIFDACSGFYRTYKMAWFIEKVHSCNSHASLRYLDRADTGQQGNPVKENVPVRLRYQQKRLVSRGPFTQISTIIYRSSDPQNTGAPKYVEDGQSTNVPFDTYFTYPPANSIPRKRPPARQSRSRPQPHPHRQNPEDQRRRRQDVLPGRLRDQNHLPLRVHGVRARLPPRELRPHYGGVCLRWGHTDRSIDLLLTLAGIGIFHYYSAPATLGFFGSGKDKAVIILRPWHWKLHSFPKPKALSYGTYFPGIPSQLGTFTPRPRQDGEKFCGIVPFSPNI